MLEVFFCNVGDGDAVLVRERGEDGRDYAVLVDAGFMRKGVPAHDGLRRIRTDTDDGCICWIGR